MSGSSKKRPPPATGKSPQKLLLVQTAFLGDCVLTLPLIEGIARRWPDAELSVLSIPASAGLFRGVSAVDEVIVFDKKGSDHGLAGTLHLIATLRKKRFDRAFLPHRSLRSSLITLLTGIRERTGFSGVPGSPLYTQRFSRPDNAHEGARNLALLGDDAADIDPRPRLAVHTESRNSIQNWLAEHELSGSSPVALAPGSVWATKRWPEVSWRRLTELLADAELPAVLVGGPADRALCESIAAGHPNVHNSAGELNVLESAELLRECRLLVTGDTAPLHLAVAVETPVLAIFGPTVPEFGFAPTGDQDRIIGLDLDCRPCAIHGGDECPLGHHDCMRRLAADRVFAVAREML